MRVLVATNEFQGTRKGDYARGVEGEIVVPEVVQCGHPACGCGRGFAGLASDRATTTAMIVDLPHVAPSDLRGIVFDWLERRGWDDLLGDSDEIQEIVDEHVDNVEVICAAYAVGTIVERDGCDVRPRGLAAAA